MQGKVGSSGNDIKHRIVFVIRGFLFLPIQDHGCKLGTFCWTCYLFCSLNNLSLVYMVKLDSTKIINETDLSSTGRVEGFCKKIIKGKMQNPLVVGSYPTGRFSSCPVVGILFSLLGI